MAMLPVNAGTTKLYTEITFPCNKSTKSEMCEGQLSIHFQIVLMFFGRNVSYGRIYFKRNIIVCIST